MSKTIKAITAAALLAAGAPAHAGGFIGDLIEDACGNCGVGAALDDLNRSLGHPTERLGAAAGDYLVPGSGPVLHGIWMNNAGVGQPNRNSRGRGAPAQMGNRCLTSWGVSNPGPWLLLGSYCHVNGNPGRVIR